MPPLGLPRRETYSVLSSGRLIWVVLVVALLIRCGFALRTPTVE
jgi:hypothetical protein